MERRSILQPTLQNLQPPDCDPALSPTFRSAEQIEREMAKTLDAATHWTNDLDATDLELSVVIPCLNESDTVAICVKKALEKIRLMGIRGEVVVADNGSCDGSQSLARDAGAIVIDVPQKGYGAALMGGIAVARGEFIIMGDADDSYDFTKIDEFYDKLRSGMDLVQGCRLPRGGGTIEPGAMPILHRWIGNPLLSFLVRTMFRTSVNDVYCGLRGFRRSWQQSLDQRCTGMEFATEMIIKSTLFGGAMDQVPVTLHPDGRIASRSHLRTFRDGWRTLRFFMLLSPRWTFLLPGAMLGLVGILLYVLALPQLTIAGISFDVHTLLVGTLAILVASQLIWCAILAKTFAVSEGLVPRNRRLDDFARIMNLERLLITSLSMAVLGGSLIGYTSWMWAAGGFGPLNYASTMRLVVPGAGLIALAFQFAASSFLLSVLRMARL